MNNSQLIEDKLIELGIYDIYQIEELHANGRAVPYHTKSEWKRKYNKDVIEGSEPIEIELWRKNKDGLFYLKKCFIYSERQVK